MISLLLSVTAQAPPAPPAPPPCGIDLVLVLDSSCSIKNASWTQAVRFVSNLTDALPIAPAGVHVGIVEFALSVTDNLEPTGDVAAVKTAISQLNPASSMGCKTHTAVGLRHGHTMLTNHGRANVSQVVLLITDGSPVPKDTGIKNAAAEAAALKKDGVTILGVGVLGSGGLNETEIKELCSTGGYFSVASWSDIDKYLNKIISASCAPRLYECVEDAGCLSTTTGGVPKDVCMKDPKCAPPPSSPPLTVYPPCPAYGNPCNTSDDCIAYGCHSCSQPQPRFKLGPAYCT